LKGRSARVVVTMGMPALLYRLLYGAHGVKAFNRSILAISGVGPIATTCLGGVSGQQTGLVEKLRKMGRRAA
jgi:putative NADPH-quinone reductase